MMKKKHVKTFLIWVALLNWPPVLIWVPLLHLLCFLPYLFWINVPALWLGLARFVGKPHYDIQEFGAMPLTPLSWILIAGFWALMALGLTILTAFIRGLLQRKRKMKEEASGHGADGTAEPAPGADSSAHPKDTI